MSSAVVGVDVVGDEDDDAGDGVVVDEDVEGGEGSGSLERPCWTPGQEVVGGTYDGLEWPCRLPVDVRRRVLELGEEEPGGLTKTMRGRWRSRAEGVGAAHTT